MLEEEGLSVLARPGVKVEVDVGLPADADLHRPDHRTRRGLRGVRQRTLGQPIRRFHFAADSEHLDLPLIFVNGPLLAGRDGTAGAGGEMLQGSRKVSGERSNVTIASIQIKSPEARDFFFVEIVDPWIAEIHPLD